eukprot:1290272-Pleurochrysis_carterae.AAC.1
MVAPLNAPVSQALKAFPNDEEEGQSEGIPAVCAGLQVPSVPSPLAHGLKNIAAHAHLTAISSERAEGARALANARTYGWRLGVDVWPHAWVLMFESESERASEQAREEERARARGRESESAIECEQERERERGSEIARSR